MSPTATQQSTRNLDTILADVRAEHDETVRGLKAALAKVTEERAAEKTRADLAEAAGVDMANTIADGLRREEALAARLRKALGEAQGLAGVCRGLQDAIDRTHAEHKAEAQGVERAHAEQVAALAGELGRLRLRLTIAEARHKRRFPGVRRRDR